MATSNVIQTIDNQGKLKFQNLDSVFGGKLEDLLTLGAGEVKVGVIVSEPVQEVVLGTADSTVKLSGPCKSLFVTANASGCTLDITQFVVPVGALFFLSVSGAEDAIVNFPDGATETITAGSRKLYVVSPSGEFVELL